ncbi:MAG: hypothetical protein AUG44_02510 [Actinobacteria bacterium 13_1_20CM_3_71_11]|nr:MAG: hypothetical protein AUG44_02510 [Actinobacteria bacterium 13_1_20CM_3_71_11]
MWRTERRYGDEFDPDERDWEREARRGQSPRDRFTTPVPISPALPPIVRPPRPSHTPTHAAPSAAMPPPAPPRRPAQPPVIRGSASPPAIPVPPPPPVAPAVARRAPRSRYDWRVTRHAARPVEVADDHPHYLATFGWTAAWFAVPFALFAAWTLTFPSSPGTACARPTGNACPSPRSAALTTLMHSFPKLGMALGIALVVAGLIRLGSTAWRPITVGFSAAIIGAGSATVLASVLSS